MLNEDQSNADKYENESKQPSVLSGQNLKVLVSHSPPWFIVNENPKYPGSFTYFGAMELLLQELKAALNFTTTVVQPPDGLTVHYNPETKNWSGIMGMVYRNEVDFALGEKANI